jgi:hypothetical protein
MIGCSHPVVRERFSSTFTQARPGLIRVPMPVSRKSMLWVAEPAFPFDTRKITIRIGLDGEWVGAVKGTHTYTVLLSCPANITFAPNASLYKGAWSERPDLLASPPKPINATASVLDSPNTRASTWTGLTKMKVGSSYCRPGWRYPLQKSDELTPSLLLL